MTYLQLLSELNAHAETDFAAFQRKLIFTKQEILGVRTPILRKIAKETAQSVDIQTLLSFPDTYYEITFIKLACVSALPYERFINYVESCVALIDNWATCDSLRPSCFKKHPFELFGMIDKWLKSEHVYTVRFAVGMLMVNYLDKNFDPEQMSKAAAACCDEYYVNMMVSWYFATALAKRYDHALLYLEQERLPLWVHNKTIQKAVESYRISAVQKAYLRTLRRR